MPLVSLGTYLQFSYFFSVSSFTLQGFTLFYNQTFKLVLNIESKVYAAQFMQRGMIFWILTSHQ